MNKSQYLNNKVFTNHTVILKEPFSPSRAVLASRMQDRFGFSDAGPFWLHIVAKIEHPSHFGSRKDCFWSNLGVVLVKCHSKSVICCQKVKYAYFGNSSILVPIRSESAPYRAVSVHI